jgi:exodeoxyribonuclease VII large subunit
MGDLNFQLGLELEPRRHIWKIRELNQRIRDLLDESFGDVWVEGEISGVRLAASGHYYFTLKDGESQVKCACFRMSARYLKFKPQDGVAVIARGRLDVYEARGEYQLLVEHIEPRGHGALQLAFEQLKKKLAAEGLFDSGRKRALPKLPKRIGIVTSPKGAVLQDMLNILARRFPGLHIRIYPAQVQGEGSIGEVCRAIRYFSENPWADVVIVARGGGSLEDLWTFNEEAVARNIAASAVPVISAVGHETDFTIADFVADLRAPTPSAAAELVVPTQVQMLDSVAGCGKRLEQVMRYRLSLAARRVHEAGAERAAALLHRRIGRLLQRTDELERCAADQVRRTLRARADGWRALDSRLRRMDLRLRFSEAHRRLEALRTDACRIARLRLSEARAAWSPAHARLEQLSPVRILERGYAIVQDEAGRVIKSPVEAPAGTRIRARLAEGEVRAVVTA